MNSDLVIYFGPSGLDTWAEVDAAYAAGVTVLGITAKGEQIGNNRKMITEWFRNVAALLEGIERIAWERQMAQKRSAEESEG